MYHSSRIITVPRKLENRRHFCCRSALRTRWRNTLFIFFVLVARVNGFSIQRINVLRKRNDRFSPCVL